MKNDGLIIDCFAGGGGASAGIEMALGRPVDQTSADFRTGIFYFFRHRT